MSFVLVALHLLGAVHDDPAYSLRMAGNLHLLIVSHMVAFADTLPHTELSSSLTVLQAT